MRHFLQLGSSTSLGIPEFATLASLHTNDGWQLPPARSEAQVQLHTMLTTLDLIEEEDYYEWEIDGRKCSRYSMGHVYYHLRDQGVSVPWFQTVWNKSGVPRHSFLSWLFVLNRCPTRDRIIGWGLATPAVCLLCDVESTVNDLGAGSCCSCRWLTNDHQLVCSPYYAGKRACIGLGQKGIPDYTETSSPLLMF
ncbi:uncharacterized protein LOC103855387 [Brassica rapa]|uniref:uncharacterized protein LOC103855387 n=1 Tax=Brassica campestris TaxID=3711 RepID=UPI0004F1816A|nr:uncharacterized protein LOC103855387 [Brassica rapa]XP_013712229.1 uncharacterized protein LOC106415958 [Brassica napus]